AETLAQRGARLLEGRRGGIDRGRRHGITVTPGRAKAVTENARPGSSHRARKMPARERRAQQTTNLRRVRLRSGAQGAEHRPIPSCDPSHVVTSHVEDELIPANPRLPELG